MRSRARRAHRQAARVILLGVILVVSQTASDVMARLFRPEFAIADRCSRSVLVGAAGALGNVYAHLLVATGRQAVLFRVNCVAATLQVLLQLV